MDRFRTWAAFILAALVLLLAAIAFLPPSSNLDDTKAGASESNGTMEAFSSGGTTAYVTTQTKTVDGKTVQTLTFSADRPVHLQLLLIAPKSEYATAAKLIRRNPTLTKGRIVQDDPVIDIPIRTDENTPIQFQANIPTRIITLPLTAGYLPEDIVRIAQAIQAVQTPTAPAVDASPTPTTAAYEERQAIDQLNQLRQSQGLKALQWDDRLQKLARQRSSDLARLGYLSHTQPRSANDMKKEFGITENAQMAENLALLVSEQNAPEAALEAWQQSPGHNAVLFYAFPDETTPTAIGCVVNICTFLALTAENFIAADSTPVQVNAPAATASSPPTVATPTQTVNSPPGLHAPLMLASRLNDNFFAPSPRSLEQVIRPDQGPSFQIEPVSGTAGKTEERPPVSASPQTGNAQTIQKSDADDIDIRTEPATKWRKEGQTTLTPSRARLGIRRIELKPELACLKNGEWHTARLDAFFTATTGTIWQSTQCPYAPHHAAPGFEKTILLTMKNTAEVPYEACQADAVITTYDLEAGKEETSNIPIHIYKSEDRGQNELAPRRLADALEELKRSGRVPRVIVTYGKHEPSEPSARLFGSKVYDPRMADYFGQDVQFIEIPHAETPAGFYEATYENVRAQYINGTIHISDPLKKKLRPVFNTPLAITLEDADLPELTATEGLELYRVAEQTIPMAEQEFANKVTAQYAGCPTPLIISVHYDKEESQIYAFDEFIQKHASLFDRIKTRTGIAAAQTEETSELADDAEKLAAEPDFRKKQAILMGSEPNPPANIPLAEELLKEYETNTGRVSAQNNRHTPMFTVEMGRPQQFQPIEGKAARGLLLRQLMFREYPKFDHLFAIGGSYLTTLDADVETLVERQKPTVRAIIQETLDESRKTRAEGTE